MLNKRLLKESNISKLYIPITILYSIINSIFIIINVSLLSLIVDGIFIKKYDLKHIKTYLILFLLNAVLKFIIKFSIEIYIKGCSEYIKDEIKKKSYNLIISSNPCKVKDENIGEIINLLTTGVEAITPYYAQYIPQFIASLVIPMIICISAAFIDRLSALIMLITYPIIPLFMILIGEKSKELNESQWRKLDILSSHFLDVLQGLTTLKVFGRSKIQEEKVFQVSENYRKSTMDVLKISFLSSLVLEISSTISIGLLAVNLGLRLVYGKIIFLNAFFILVIAPEFYLPMRQLGLKFHASLNGQVAIEKIEQIEKKLKEKKTLGNKICIEKNNFTIEVKNLSFSHKNRETLNNISFKILPQEKVALIGDSGSGKSTLLNILSGFLQVKKGMVFVNHYDINDIDKHDYMNKITVIPQFPHIFNMNIENNILLGRKDIDNNKLLNIYRCTKLLRISEKFKNKYNTFVGEGEDAAISGGEKQRIAWARALVKDADFLVLDEPTSALDANTEEIITGLMQRELKNKTILIATHRLNTIKAVDKILVLYKGALVEVGTHEELMLKRGRYYNLISQSLC
ncbi:thiol reductant ABC exporter subunit CydD [Clostridium sp. DJ247]|uniref:thiol reductant ABC exporter subunit CydD n=1 Tax=Clostridium sp. DJ247 TaxID=2726188 RepID=UPI0016241FF1|nr:thiol reductant ABC exporter subunit CydD [Clostridium sp. DJ247]MBC2580413.1 thiol reductant ABC exporter subunit CydD [Clostridium sp. DJ247]